MVEILTCTKKNVHTMFKNCICINEYRFLIPQVLGSQTPSQPQQYKTSLVKDIQTS